MKLNYRKVLSLISVNEYKMNADKRIPLITAKMKVYTM